MRSEAERARRFAEVRRAKRHHQTGAREPVLDREIEREGVAGLGAQPVTEAHAIRGPALDVPFDPAHQAVNRIAELGFVDRQLMVAARKVIATVGNAVGPGRHQLSRAAGTNFGRAETVENRALADSVGA